MTSIIITPETENIIDIFNNANNDDIFKIESGTYNFKKNLQITKSIKLVGDCKNKPVFMFKKNYSDSIEITGNCNVTIENLIINSYSCCICLLGITIHDQ